jgi:hypothetical protein
MVGSAVLSTLAMSVVLIPSRAILGVVSAPLWNSETSKFAGMLTVLDIIHLIQYYYHNASYDSAASDVEYFKLESLRGACALRPFNLPIFNR